MGGERPNDKFRSFCLNENLTVDVRRRTSLHFYLLKKTVFSIKSFIKITIY